MAIEKDLGAVSAYAIACENGFEGTEEEWLESLIGPMGYQGWSVSAVRATTTGQLIFTVTDPKTGETRELDPVQGDTIDALKEIEDAAEDAKNQVKEAANAASASAVKAVEGAQNAGVQAVKDTETAAVEAVTSAQTAGVQAVQGAQTTALDAITEAQTQATEAVGTAKTQAVQAVEDAENTGVSAVEDAKSNALTEVGKAKTTAVDAVNAAGTQAASDAQTAITTAKNQAVSDVQNAGQSAVGAVGDARTTAVEAVEDAQTNAVQAVENAGTAEIEKINDILPVPTEADNGKILTVVDGKWAARDPGYPAETWADIQKIVRLGAAPQYFPVGYEFATHDSINDTDIIWRVVGYDTIQAADESLTHTMVLETKYVYSISGGAWTRRCFDEKESIYYAEEELAPGTYCITMPANYGETVDTVETSVSFTLTQPVPAGGVIVYDLPIATTISDKYRMKTYLNQMSTSPVETVATTIGLNGISLGIADGSVQNVNYCDRAIGGSNNYAQSAIRQLLNSSADAGEFWTPQTRFDMVPSWHGDQPGMMARFPDDFLAVVQPAIIKCATNNIYETNNLDGTTVIKNQEYTLNDRFFLLSAAEIYGNEQGADSRCGEQLEFYEGLSNAEKIKYDAIGSSCFSWLREAGRSTTYKCRYVAGSTGELAGSNASYTGASFTVACIIA